VLAGCGRDKEESAYGPGNEWVDDMRGLIEKKIDDPQKVTDLLVVVDNIEEALIEMDHAVKAHYSRLDGLDRNYHSTRDEFKAAFDDFNAKRLQIVDRMIGYMSDMKRIAGREDWKTVSDIDKTLYESWQRTYEI